jgi:hemin uptake protein HemP
MDLSPRPGQTADGKKIEVTWDGPGLDIPVVDSLALMNGRRELVIRHNDQAYRLRVTASDKLILTK